jgi:2-polyprenyl-3-methyl-5-hydroxy-6-metoxy-1,4-benzoquinol methylase
MADGVIFDGAMIMAGRDVFQSLHELPPDAVERIVQRLEFRGNDPVFIHMRETYLERLALEPDARVLDLGCGTGVVSRSLARQDNFVGSLIGVDFSEALVAAACRLASREGTDDRIVFRVGDAHALDEPADSYDAVIAHTLVSHVVDPAAVVAEAVRVLRPGGALAVFDGDYASLSYGAGAQAANVAMVDAILAAVVANPYVLRAFPTILHDAGLTISDFLPHAFAEAGTGSFFINLAESYVPMAVGAGHVASDEADRWLTVQRNASSQGAFFGACNYYTYLARKPG